MKSLSKELLLHCKTEEEHSTVSEVLRQGSNKKAAKYLGVHRRTVDRRINSIVERAVMYGGYQADTTPKILVIDIETAPAKQYLWSLWQKFHSVDMNISPTYILCWAAKWLGEEEVMTSALIDSPDYTPGMENDVAMLTEIWNLLDEADFVVAHNGDRFDIPKLNTAFFMNGFNPPAPYKQIDTLKIFKRTFGFDSNKLDYLLTRMYDRRKGDSGGFDTWVGCMEGDRDAWDKMLSYNVGDVRDLEQLYLDVRGWDKNHPSAATHGGTRDIPVCTTCGSEDLEITGTTQSTSVSVFPVFRCKSCGGLSRGRHSTVPKDTRNAMLMKAR